MYQDAGSSTLFEKEEIDEDNEHYEPDENLENLKEVPSEFIENILNIKHILYEKIILGPDIDSDKAQDTSLVNDYVNKLNSIHRMANDTINNNTIIITDPITLTMFPKEAAKLIANLLNDISEYYNNNNNSEADRIPYSYYINYHFHEHPFLQEKSYIYE